MLSEPEYVVEPENAIDDAANSLLPELNATAVPKMLVSFSDNREVPDEKEAEPPDNESLEKYILTFVPEVIVVDIATKTPPRIETNEAIFREPPLSAKTPSWIIPAVA
jgi:hypothetical protein